MTKEKLNKIYLGLEEKNGKSHQLTVCIEELSELIKELSKWIRNKGQGGNEMKIIEEIADVEITLDQMKLFFDHNNGVEFFKEFKLKRLEKYYLRSINNENNKR